MLTPEDSSNTKKNANAAIAGAKIGFLLAVSYYFYFGILFSITQSYLEWSLVVLTSGLLPGLLIGFLPAAVLGSLTGLIAPRLLARYKPGTGLQAGLLGLASCVLPTVGLYLLLFVLGPINPFALSFGTVFLLWLPLLIYFGAAAYVCSKLAVDAGAPNQIAGALLKRPLAVWLFMLPMTVNIAILAFLAFRN